MTEEQLAFKIIHNIQLQHRDFGKAIKRIVSQKLDLFSTLVFDWRNTPEGTKFWHDVAMTKCNNYEQLMGYLRQFIICNQKDNFITLELLV